MRTIFVMMPLLLLKRLFDSFDTWFEKKMQTGPGEWTTFGYNQDLVMNILIVVFAIMLEAPGVLFE